MNRSHVFASFRGIMKLLFPIQLKRHRKSLLMVTAQEVTADGYTGLTATPKRIIFKDKGQQTL